MTPSPTPHDPAGYWEDRCDQIGDEHVSWFQNRPAMSLELIATIGADPSTGVIDVGGGSSRLVDELITPRPRRHHRARRVPHRPPTRPPPPR